MTLLKCYRLCVLLFKIKVSSSSIFTIEDKEKQVLSMLYKLENKFNFITKFFSIDLFISNVLKYKQMYTQPLTKAVKDMNNNVEH